MKTIQKLLLRILVAVGCATLLLALFVTPLLPTSKSHEGHDHGEEEKITTQNAKQPVVSQVIAERNVKTGEGQFNIKLQRGPADPRSGEQTQMHVRFAERVEGGFGEDTQPLEGLKITTNITTADNKAVSQNIKAEAEGKGIYHISYIFESSGDYKIAFAATTSDNRQFSVDFPISVIPAPVNWTFWFVLAALVLIVGGAFASLFMFFLRRGGRSSAGEEVSCARRARIAVPVAAGLLLFFTLATVTLAYLQPPRKIRATIQLPEMDEHGHVPVAGDAALGGSGTRLIAPKESQVLFKILTHPVTEREITGGLKVAGVVKARPDAKAILSPPVSGRVFLRQRLTIGSAVGRGEQIGTVEQVLGAPDQANLEAQRVALRTAALEQQAKKSQQEALAQQARTLLAQAQRELKRSQNLYEVGAAPKRRVEEAETAVKLAQEDVASAEKQARAAGEQAKLAQEAVSRVAPVRLFPLTSPVTGLISEMKVTSGQHAEAGAELLNVVNLSTVFLEAQVFERDLERVRESTRASYTAAGIPGEVYKIGVGGDGHLLTVGQAVNPETRAVPVIYEVKNPLNKLRDGMFVEITIDTTGSTKVLSVPKGAVVTEQGRTFVFVFLGGETFEKRAVVLGTEGQDFYEVKTGIKSGERVVVEGVYQLRSVKTD